MPVRGSWYSQAPAFGWFDKEDKPNSAAYQVGGRSIPDSQQGIALPSRSTLGQWFNVTGPDGRTHRLQQTDIGPAPWTGRGVDISAAAAHGMGYTPRTFPTDAQFDVKPADGPDTSPGTAFSPSSTSKSDDGTAEASSTSLAAPEAKKMPSLMDLFTPSYDASGAPATPGFDLGGALAQRQNSLIGLGLGLASAKGPGLGSALEGFQAGARTDAANLHAAQLAKERALDRQEHRADRTQAQSNWEKQFARSDPATAISEAQRAMRDVLGPDATPEAKAEFMRSYYQSKTEAPQVVWQEDANGNKVPYIQDPRRGTIKRAQVEGGLAGEGQPSNPYATGGKQTADESKVSQFADRAAAAHSVISKYENLNQQPGGTVGGLVEEYAPAGVANKVVSGDRGLAMNAKRAFVNALLRRESGAAIGAGEFTSYDKEYFPQVGDTPDQIDYKRKHRAEVISGLAREGGKGYRPTYTFDEKGNITLPRGTTMAPPGGATSTPPQPAAADPLKEARDAINRGAPRDAVIRRLREKNIDTRGL